MGMEMGVFRPSLSQHVTEEMVQDTYTYVRTTVSKLTIPWFISMHLCFVL